jgi:aromatic-L-amino-acid decarboxylase
MYGTLELNGAAFRALVDAAMDRIVAHIDSLPDQPSNDVDGAAELARALAEPVPEQGTSADETFDLLFERAIPKSFNTAGPGYLAYIPGGGILHSAVADLIADAVNRYTGVWLAAPGLVQLESNVLRWLCDMVGFPSEAHGLLTTGGSLATFSAVVTARETRLPPDFLRGVIYVSEQIHHSVTKAAHLAGFRSDNIRIVGSDRSYRMRIDELERQVVRDRESGHVPFLVVASAGTVNTGAVDDLESAADVAARHGLWLHVDAAYGGFFMLTARGRAAMRGIELADSITLDPHKGLFLPYGTGSLLVRDGKALHRAHELHGAYLPAMQEQQEFVDFCQLSPELSRAYRGLRIWLPFKLTGVDAFRRALDEKLDLARWATEQLREIEGLEIVAEPELSIVAFRMVWPELGLEETNGLNQSLLDAVNGRKRVYLTGTSLQGRFVIRICVLSFRTHRDRMEMALEDIRNAVLEVNGGRGRL